MWHLKTLNTLCFPTLVDGCVDWKDKLSSHIVLHLLCAGQWPASQWRASGCPLPSDRPGRSCVNRRVISYMTHCVQHHNWSSDQTTVLHWSPRTYLHCAWKYLMRFWRRSTPFLILISFTLRRYYKGKQTFEINIEISSTGLLYPYRYNMYPCSAV